MIIAPKTLLMINATALLCACSVPNAQTSSNPAGTPLAAPIVTPEASAAPMAMEAPAVVIAPPPSSRASNARAGVVTAGDINDTLNLPAFLRFQNTASDGLNLRKANLTEPVMVQLRGPSGTPAPGVRVTLRRPGAADPFYDGYSGVDGMISVFPATLGQSRMRNVELRAFPGGDGPAIVKTLATSTTRQAVTLPVESAWAPDFLDLVFVVDTTGSMSDELTWLSQEITQITRQAQSAAPGVDIRFGLVVYKAPADPYVVKSYGFTSDVGQFTRWIASERSSGGAGGPEVVADALNTAVQLDWRRGRGERLIFQIGDEPPHPLRTRTYYDAAQTAAANGIQVFGLAASGVEAQLEYLMRQGAVMTGGRYLFLTDDSGVGLSHAEPTISCYQVTRLNDLVVRVLRSELSGRRVEAAPSEVIREVGSYQNGICRN
ncbi:vWA domain-containing protein [Yoonia sp. SS1-5]|uniref:VWA domain-containing protein n=1 Tax=Yoonia rhodophyticola TaxID=3137370 RepID=A0AAN0MBN2_9RHOB